jgi:hypothetical protein
MSSFNRTRRIGWGPTNFIFSPYGVDYDKGHFIAHGFRGPVDVNIFPQRPDINRVLVGRWKTLPENGKICRSESWNLGFFATYLNLTECPYFLEYGYFDQELNLQLEVFPNSYPQKNKNEK